MALKTSLISYWKLDEASGTRYDSHGTNDLTDNNTVGSATGKIGNAADFNGSNQYLSHASNSDLQTGDIDFEIAGWVYLDSIASVVTVIGRWQAAGGYEYTINYRPSHGCFEIYIYNGGFPSVVSTVTISASTWYYLRCFYDATNNLLGISVNNETPVTSSQSPGPIAGTSNFEIGRQQDGGGSSYTDGRLDEVAFWKRILTSDERTEIYNSGAGLSYDDWDVAAGQPTVKRFGGVQFASSNLAQGIMRW